MARFRYSTYIDQRKINVRVLSGQAEPHKIVPECI